MGSSRRVATDRNDDRRWARSAARHFASPVATVAARVAREFGLDGGAISALVGRDPEPLLATADDDALCPPPGGWCDPWLVGEVHEYAVAEEERSRRGAWYTPRQVARDLVALTFDVAGAPGFTVDPCCGGGGFLLAAAERLLTASLGGSGNPGSTGAVLDVVESIGGGDIDSGAVQATTLALTLWAVGHGVAPAAAREAAERRIAVADSLSFDSLRSDSLRVDAGADESNSSRTLDRGWPLRRIVVGNPPFASPLKKGAIDPITERYRQCHVEDLGPYADQAFFHLHRAVSSCGPGSVVMLIQPQSLLAGRDGGPLRIMLDRQTSLLALWVTRRAVFDAGIRVCAPVLRVGEPAQQPPVRLLSDVGERTVPPHDPVTDVADGASPKWSALAATALGAPDLPPGLRHTTRNLSSLVKATAGFRDEYYGLAAAAREHDGTTSDSRRLLTVGSVEPLSTTWGHQSVRIAGNRWLRPVVELNDLDPKVRCWTKGQLQPKVVLATQSKVLEPVVDPGGDLIPLTPLISVICDPSDLDLVAAVLLAPPVVAWAWQKTFGTAMSVDAVKLAARDVGTLPLPDDRRRWEQAATVVAEGREHLGEGDVASAWQVATEAARLMTEAYRAGPEVTRWWLSRAKKSWRIRAVDRDGDGSQRAIHT